MTLREKTFVILYIAGYVALMVGAFGQASLFGLMLKPELRPKLATVGAIVSCVPCLIVYVITFFKVSFLPPRPFRLCCVIAMLWFAGITISAEVLLHFGYMPPEAPDQLRILARALMHSGWLGFVTLIHLYNSALQAELG